MYHNETTIALANAFSGVLNEWIPDKLFEVNLRNKEASYAGCCATHDFCDSNMAMAEAFQKVMKRDLGIFHPTCTYLTVTANKWLKDQPERKSGALVGHARRSARKEAIDFFIKIANSSIESIVIENPVRCISSVWRKPDQIIQPMMFGHKEPKKTCLWLKNMPLLKATNVVEPEYHITASGKRLPKWYAYADKSQGQAKRAEIRSVTFPGIAKAMAEQYVAHLINPPVKQTLF